MNWKTVAIVLIVVLILENAFLFYSYNLVVSEEEDVLECYYEICADYPDAQLDVDGVCHCYDTDLLGNLIIAKSKLMD